MTAYLLAIDQGTTNSRAIIFNKTGEIIGQHELPLTLAYPHDGWVEQDAEEMFTNTVLCCRQVLSQCQLPANAIAAIGISNQRETTIIWNRATGKPIYPAIVWQDRRTHDICERLKKHAIHATLAARTGLLLDPYFSATKILWILDQVPQAREQAERGELAFGTVDSYLLWRLTDGKSHATDATNASRTLLFNIITQEWDDAILSAFAIPKSLLPQVLDSSADFGFTVKEILGHSIQIAGIAGDQQAATVGQTCFTPGMIKTTYGTGGFTLLNTGDTPVHSSNQLVTTIAYRLQNQVTYGLEGSFFCAGATIKWLRDNLKLITTAGESEQLAKKTKNNAGVYLVPAFTGLGAPYWDTQARGALLGLTRDSGVEQIVRAALEAVAYQSLDLLIAMQNDIQMKFSAVRVDGGMVANNWLLQFIADILQLEVQRPNCIETSALGAAFLAGLHVGIYQSLAEISQIAAVNSRFHFQMPVAERDKLYQGWKNAVARVLLMTPQ